MPPSSGGELLEDLAAPALATLDRRDISMRWLQMSVSVSLEVLGLFGWWRSHRVDGRGFKDQVGFTGQGNGCTNFSK